MTKPLDVLSDRVRVWEHRILLIGLRRRLLTGLNLLIDREHIRSGSRLNSCIEQLGRGQKGAQKYRQCPHASRKSVHCISYRRSEPWRIVLSYILENLVYFDELRRIRGAKAKKGSAGRVPFGLSQHFRCLFIEQS
jgi:uncharacterized protein (DUF1684 family)